MNNNTFKYKGFYTQIKLDCETNILHGKIEGIHDLVTFESNSIKDIEKEFHNAVDDYLDFCKEVGKKPEKAYNGVFNVRIAPEIHRMLAAKATENGTSLNAEVKHAILNYLNSNSSVQFS